MVVRWADSVIQQQEGEGESERREWRQKAQLPFFYFPPISGTLGTPTRPSYVFSEGLAIFRQMVPKIQAMLGITPCYGLVKQPHGRLYNRF